tara:strand:+ start:2555 stop:3271 length:717 start_codon:yes stop_codon:yes gene_type:complete
MDIKEQILVALGLNKDKEIKLSWQAKSEDGTIFVSTADELESGVDISVLTEDGTTILLPVGTYKTDTGISFRVETEGIVAEVIESETEEDVTVEEEDMGEDRGEDDDEVAVDDWEGMEKRIKNLEDAVADLKERLAKEDEYEDEEDKEEEVEMTEEVSEEASETPKTVTTKTTEVVEFSAEDVENLKTENAKLKAELDKSPAEAPINTNKFSSDKANLSRKEYNRLSKQERFLYNLNK